jgi:RimJ/RimL family protein N-acetyltransferase
LATPDDLPAIVEIRRHPLVAPHQYRFSYPMWLEICLARLNADVSTTGFEWRITTILFESKIVGYISELRTFRNSEFSVHVGWSLHPDYWGRGVMTTALTEFLTNLLSSKHCTTIVADCFESNERCLRLLTRLGFSATPIGGIERFLTWITRLCPYRILRHKLDATEWSVKPKAEIAG